MKPAQALDFGLNVCGVLLLHMFVLLAAQAEVLTTAPGPAIDITLARSTSTGQLVLSGPGFTGTVDDVRADLRALCAVPAPPALRLVFPSDTLLSDAHDTYAAIDALPDVVCPLSY